MVPQPDFLVERWMDEFEHSVEINIAETCCWSLSIDELVRITGRPFPADKLAQSRLVYGAIPGSESLRTSVAEMLQENSRGPLKVAAGDVLVTNGAIGANFLVYFSLVAAGDHVIVVDPAYQQLASVPETFGAEVSRLPLIAENGYLPDLDQLQALVRPNTKMITINNPHNPSGAVIPEPLLQKIVDIARDAGAYLLSDEVYRPLFFSDQAPSSAVCLYERAIVTGSMSKAFGMAGLRLGWIVSPDHAVIEQCLSHRDYTTISVGLIDDLIASWALTGRHEIIAHNRTMCKTNLQVLDDFLRATAGAVTCVSPNGGTTAFLKLAHVQDTSKFCRAFIARHRTLVVPGETFGCPGYLRIGFANETEELRQGLARLAEFVASYNE